MEDEIRVKIRTGTSTRSAIPQSTIPDNRQTNILHNRNIPNLQLEPRFPISFEIISYDRPLTYSDVYRYVNRNQVDFNSVLERSLQDAGLRRNPIIQLDLNTHTCRTSEIDNECTICSLKLALGDKLTTIESCNHTFHYSCLQEWGKYKQECPLCRNSIPILER